MPTSSQLYVHESDTSILQPVRKLEGFQRVSLAPGQSQTVTFTLGPQNLGFYNDSGPVRGASRVRSTCGSATARIGGTHTTFTLR